MILLKLAIAFNQSTNSKKFAWTVTNSKSAGERSENQAQEKDGIQLLLDLRAGLKQCSEIFKN